MRAYTSWIRCSRRNSLTVYLVVIRHCPWHMPQIVLLCLVVIISVLVMCIYLIFQVCFTASDRQNWYIFMQWNFRVYNTFSVVTSLSFCGINILIAPVSWTLSPRWFILPARVLRRAVFVSKCQNRHSVVIYFGIGDNRDTGSYSLSYYK